MRVTSFIVYDRIKNSLERNWQTLYDANERLASGKRINRPSDDIIGTVRGLDYKVEIRSNKQNLSTINDVRAFLEYTGSTLNFVNEDLTRLKELILSGLNQDKSQSDRISLAKEVTVLKESLLSYTNQKLRDRYIFSGFKTDKPAFDELFTYQGDTNAIKVKVGNNAYIKENVTGVEAFSYTQMTHKVDTLEKGMKYVHYIPGQVLDPDNPSNRTIIVISSSDDKAAVINELADGPLNTVTDSFSFDNYMEMTQRLEDALNSNDLDRLGALLRPIDESSNNVVNVMAEMGSRINAIDIEQDKTEDNIIRLRGVISKTEDADIAKTVSDISRAQVAIDALRQSSVKIISQSLFDFMR